jgi:arylsulfatase A-like enzyme
MTTKNYFRTISLGFALIGLASFQVLASNPESDPKPKSKKPNILFIAVDDLKPNTAAYGDLIAKTPGMDQLAKQGIVFQRSYCSQAICAATRASILTGMRPDKTRVWDLVTDFRQVNPNVVTIPEYFKSNGYETAGMGKIYHMGSTGPGHDGPSWSIPYRDAKCPVYALPYVPNEKGRGKAVECADVPDNTYHDGKLTGMAIELLDSLSKNDKPFFLAVGFLRPHLPFVAPKKYWDMYDRSKFELAPFQDKALNSPNIAYHRSGELKNYSDIPDFDSYSEKDLDHLPADKQRELIHGYYASMSYMDAQIMQLLDKLDKLGIRENTIIVLWGDHGWHLGDHGLWNKHTNFEQATHTLLMMSVPGTKPGIRPLTLSEFTDVFPTLCELTNIPVPKYLDGISLVPAIKNPAAELREYAFSQYPRENAKIMGYTIRTGRFRYTEWMKDSYRTNMPYDKKYVMAREMYDYEKDPNETVSIIDKPEYQKDQKEMEKLFLESLDREYKSCTEYSKIADFKTPVRTDIKTGKSNRNEVE